MSPTLTVIKPEKPAPKKRGPKPGTHPRKEVAHVCPSCGVHFTATAKRIYDTTRCRRTAYRRRVGIPERKRNAATAKTA